MEGALSGIRVLDMTSFVAGPYSTMLLSDLGAEVIKVEAPPLGDPNRFRENDTGYSTGFAAINRNKKSLFLDFNASRGSEIFDRLLATSDALVTSIRPRSRLKLGIGYEQLRERFPRLVYCSLSGLGEQGRTLDRPAFDTTAQALSGLLSLITTDFDKPVRIRSLLSDQLAGLYACYGVLGALIARERTGRGQYVSTSLLQASIAFSGSNFAAQFNAERAGRPSASLRTAGFLFICGDDLPMAIHVPPSPPKTWFSVTAALEQEQLREDPRFQDKDGREKNYEQLHAVLAEHVKTQSRDYWLARLDEHDVPCAPVNMLGDVFHDPLVQELGMLAHIQNPFGQDEAMVGSGVNLSETPAGVRAPAPLLGDDTDALLRELGYSEPEIGAYNVETDPLKPASLRRGQAAAS